MKNYDLLKVIATKLNLLQIGASAESCIKEIEDYCKKNGIVICYGESDDLMELRGAIYDEYGCYVGGTICIDENGNSDSDANKYFPIEAVWSNDFPLWSYKFEPKHEEFSLYDDENVYCIGMVFFADDLKRENKVIGKEFAANGIQNNNEIDEAKLALAKDYITKALKLLEEIKNERLQIE